MNGEFEGVIGHFDSADALRRAILRVREAGLTDLEIYLPVGDSAAVEEIHGEGSPVRWVAIAAGLAGFALALWMTIAISRDYPLITGGKPIVSLPPFLVIAFEAMILFGALGTVAGFLWQSRLPDLRPSSAYRQSLSVDTFALLVRSLPAEADRTRAEGALSEAGAEETRWVRREDRSALGEVP